MVLGAFWIEGTDQHFFGLRDAKNYQIVKGGNILDPNRKLLYPDPFPNAANCTGCGNKVTPTGAFLGAEMNDLPARCGDCGGKLKPKPSDMAEAAVQARKKSGSIFGFFKRS